MLNQSAALMTLYKLLHSFLHFILATILEKCARRKRSNHQQPLSRLIKLKKMNLILKALLEAKKYKFHFTPKLPKYLHQLKMFNGI